MPQCRLSQDLSVLLPGDVVDEIIDRVTERVLERPGAEAAPTPNSPYMTVAEAAEYLRCGRQRIDDLLSQRRLTRHKDGRRTLVSRAELEAHAGGAR